MASEEQQRKLEQCKRRVNLIFEPLEIWPFLERVWLTSPRQIIQTLAISELRGRGGAGFPTWRKWKMALENPADHKHVVCNADEGEPGTFKDREILEKQAEKLFAGITACGHAVGSESGTIYLRGEYSYLVPLLQKKLSQFHAGLRERKRSFRISIRLGSGAYICGEETALIESMEGRRGEPRNKPPFPVNKGFLGEPTVVNNVETLVLATMILRDGPERFRALGTSSSHGSKIFCISGDAAIEGIYELEFGMTVAEFVELFGTPETKAVQIGGAAGHCVPRKNFETTILGFEGIPTGGSMMLFNENRSMYHVLKNYLEFFMEESCGQCTPCRVGTQQLLRGIQDLKQKRQPEEYLNRLLSLAQVMRSTSKCGLGQSVANPFLSIVSHFKEEILS